MSDSQKNHQGFRASVKHTWNKLLKSPTQSRLSTPTSTSLFKHTLQPTAGPLASTLGSRLAADTPSPPATGHPPLTDTNSLPPETPNHASASLLLGPNNTTSQSLAQTVVISTLQSLHQISGVFPPFQSAIGMLLQCVETLEVASEHCNDYEKLISSLIDLSESLTQHLQGSKSIRMSEFVNRITISIQAQIDIINQKRNRGQGRHLIETKHEQEDVLGAYQEIQALLTQLQLHASMGLWNVIDQQHVDSRLHQMTPSKLAAYDSKLCDDINRRSCTKGTRVQVLAELSRWSLDSDAPNIYWMNGMAGTGKTTIAHTFAKTLQSNNSLGASFFCTRTEGECRDVGQIIPTVAYQLAHCSTHYQSALIHTLEADSDVTSRAISDQFRRLLVEPLMSVKDVIQAGMVVIIDALDECSDPKGVERILDVLLNTAARLPVRFFVTSRPDPLIQSRVNNQSDQTRSMLVLHEIEKSLVQSDIELYLREELAFMTISFDQLKQLTDRSGCLFIYAATAIRYIRAHGAFVDHEERLKNILDVSPSASRQHEEIDGLYMTVLERALENRILEESERKWMRLTLWTAVCTCQPVSVETLAALIEVNASKASIYLQSLFSVLHLSRAGQTISTLHASFPDFLFDKRRSGRFHCEASGHNQYLSERCFGIMKQQLRFNICGLKSSFLWDSEVPGLKDRINQEVPSTLTYATHHWADHVARSTSSELAHALLRDFLSNRLLFWIEVMNLKQALKTGIAMLSSLKSWLPLTTEGSATELWKLLNDCWTFLSQFAAGSASRSTPHIYISALAFCHHTSSVYKSYWPHTRRLLALHGSAVEQSQTALLATWNMHSHPLSLAFSSDGSQFAVGFKDGTVSILDAHTGVPVLGPLEDHTDWVRSVALSPDGLLLASCSDDRTVIVRDAYTGTHIYDSLQGHEDWVTSVCFSPDGHNLLSGSRDHTTRIWDSRTGKAIPNSVKYHPHPVNYAAYSLDGKLIACGLDSDECPMIVYSVPTGEPVSGGFDAYHSSVRSVTFSPDGMSVVTGHASGDICVWSVQDGVLTHGPLKAHQVSIRSVRFSPTGNRLVTASHDRSVYVWDPQNHYADPCLFGTHQHWVYSALFSPDGTRILSCSSDRTVKVWNTLHSISPGNAPWKSPTKPVHSVTFSPDGSRIAAASADHAIYIFSAHDATPALDPLVAHTDEINSVTFSADSRCIASGGDDCAVCLWDGTSGKLLSGPLRVHTARVWSVSISPDGTRLVSGSEDGTMRMWDVGDSTLTVSDLVATHSKTVYSASFSPDGKRIVSGCEDGKIRMWSSQTLTLVLDPFGSQSHTDEIRSVMFSPDGRLVASGSNDRTICVFDSHTGHLVLGPLRGHTDWVRSVVFSPDGTHILSGSFDRTVRVWKVRDGAPACEPLVGHQGEIMSVGYSPDGESIVSGSYDSTVRVWKAPRGRDESCPSGSTPAPLEEIKSHGPIFGGLSMSGDGWVKNGNSQRLFWIPPDIVKYFPTLETVYTIGKEGIMRVYYGAPLFLGDEWHRCYVR